MAMDIEIKAILAKGLSEGYVGKGVRGKAVRIGISLETNEYQGLEGKYRDEWAGHQNGGGQEIAEAANGGKATRVYAGGSLDVDGLKKLWLTDKDVIEKLIFFINQLGEKTRQDQDAVATEGVWNYSYKVLKSVKEIPVEVGEEEIRFHDNLVFIHYHINSPIR